MIDRLATLPMWHKAAIAVTATLFMALGAPPQGITWLIWLGFVPFMLVLRTLPADRIRGAFALGVAGGMCSGLVGFPWIAEMLERFGDFSAPVAMFGLVVFATWMAIPFGVWAVAVVLGPRHGWIAIAWPVVAYVAIADLWPQLFPYTVVIGFGEAPAWMQAAEIGGVALVEAQVVAFGVLVADAILRLSDRAARRPVAARLVAATAIPLLSLALGHARLAAVDAEIEAAPQRVRFGIVQPNVPLLASSRADSMKRLRIMSARAQDEGAQVIVWPEAGAFPYQTKRPFLRDFDSVERKVLSSHELPTIFGAASIDRGGRWEYNTVYNMRIDGTVEGAFDKNILVPFGEYVPIVDPSWAIRHVPTMAHNIAGTEPARFEVQPAATREQPEPGPPFFAGPLVCYEDIFAGFARDVAALPGGIDVFVNVTIDTWFGVTAEPWEHLALAQFRSVEHRVPMVRSVAAGVSSVVDAGGRVVAQTDVRDPEGRLGVPPERLVTDVALPRNTERQPTIYARGGWLLPHACQLLVLLALARLGTDRYRRRVERLRLASARADG